MNIKKINYLASLYENLVSFAALEDELIKLETSDDNKNFIKNISDVKYKGKIFSFLKKNPKISLQDLESQLKKEKAEDEKKEKLKESAIPPEWSPIINHLNTPEKLKVYLRSLARAKKLPNLTEEVKHQLETIKNWLEENPDEAIDTLTFQELFDTADEWLTETQKTETTKYEKIEIVYGPEWKNKQFNGHYITTITTENDLRLEGNLMSHCVGGYYPNVKEGSKKIFSLRSSSGKPLVTMDVSPDMYWFKQTFGYNNQQPNQLEMSMVNEWKQSLHPKDKIIELANGSEKDQIKAAQFMDYNDVKYKQIIDSFIQNGSDSGKEFLGIATENDPKDVLQALAANETLSEICYEQIYQKCSKNMSTVFNLIRNGSISSNLFRKLFDNHKKDEAILTIIASSIKMKEISFDEEIIQYILDFKSKSEMLLRTLLNNPSIKSSKIKKILNELSLERLQSLFNDDEFVNNSDPKFIDDILESNNPHLEKFYFKILLENKNLNNKVLEKFYKKYGKKPIKVNKKDLLELNFAKLANKSDSDLKNEYIISNDEELTPEKFNTLINQGISIRDLIKTKKLTQKLFDLITKLDYDLVTIYLPKNPYLTSEQIDTLLNMKIGRINANLSERKDLTPEQINILLNYNDKYDCHLLAKNANLTKEQFNILLNNDYIWDLAQNPHLTPEQINFLLKKNGKRINVSLAYNPNLTAEQIDFLMQKNNEDLNVSLARNKNLTVEQIDFLMQKNDQIIDEVLARNLNLTQNQINSLLKKNNYHVDSVLSYNPNLKEEQINILLNKNNHIFDGNLAHNPNLTAEQINILISRGGQVTYNGLIKNLNLTKDQFYTLFIKEKDKYKLLLNDYNTISQIKRLYGSKIPEKYSYILTLANKFLKLATVLN